MFSFIKNLFRESRPTDLVSKSSSAVAVETEKSAPAHFPEDPVVLTTSSSDRDFLELPLVSIVDRFPAPLREKLGRTPGARETALIPLPSVLAQLRHGAVRVSFGELRATAPSGIFRDGSELDQTPVEVPLSEILPRLKPASFARRPEQRQLQVPAAITPVFTSAQFRAAHAEKPAPVAKPQAVFDGDDLRASRLMAETTLGSAAPAPAPGPTPRRAPVAEPPSAVPPKTAVAAPTPTAEEGLVKVSLAALARNWPEPMRHEILEVHLAASVNIPFAELERALARGRANFKWSQIRQWLLPQSPNSLSGHDDVSMELPLSVLIPPFLARRSVRVAPAPSVEAAANIPDIFLSRSHKQDLGRNGVPLAEVVEVPLSVLSAEQRAPEPSAPVVAKPIPMSAMSAVVAPTAQEPTPAKPVPAPKDVVQRACRLSGVGGAFVATLDGLIVASQLPPGMSPENAAAFLPQFYNRAVQYARELKLGAPAEVTLLLDKTHLEIYKTSSAYFAVLGKASEVLPKPQLNALASQLTA